MEQYRGQLVEAGEEFIECHDQFLRRALGGQAGKTLDVGKENTEKDTNKSFIVDTLLQRGAQLPSIL